MMQVQQGNNNNNSTGGTTTVETNNSTVGGKTADEVRNSGDDEGSNGAGKQRLSSSATAIGDLVIDESGDEDDVSGMTSPMTSSPSQKENKTPQNCKSGSTATNVSNGGGGAGLKLETVNKNFKISDAR